MPVIGIIGSKGPLDGMPGKTLLDIEISDNVVSVIKGHENAIGNERISGDGDNGKQNTDEIFQPLLSIYLIHAR